MSALQVIIFGQVLLFFNVECSQPRTSCLISNEETLSLVKNYIRKVKLKVDCSFKGFTKVPDSLPTRTSMLDIHGNNLARLENNSFIRVKNVTIIDLSNNALTYMDAGAFDGLFLLEILNLAGNRLCLPTSYPEGVFKDLAALKILKTFSNDCTRHKSIPDGVLKDLVSLEKLSLDATENFTFGPGFRFLKNLTHVEASSRLDKCYNYNIAIRDQSLVGLQDSKLTHLTLRGCAFRNISNRALNELPFIETLNFACASLQAETLFRALQGMSSDTLKTLVIDGIDRLFTSYSENNQFCHSKFVNLQRLSLRGTRLSEKLVLDQNRKACTPHLHHLNLGYNRLDNILIYTLPHFILKRGVRARSYWSLTNIRTVDLTDLYGQLFAVENNFCASREQEIEEYFRKPPKFLEEVPDLENFNVRSDYVKSNGRLNFSDSELNKGLVGYVTVSPGTQILFAESVYAGQTWDYSAFKLCPYIMYPFDTISYFNVTKNNALFLNCPTIGIKSLRVLDASFCHLVSIHVDVLKQKYTPILEILYAKGNRLNNSLDFPELFSEATSLKELDFSQNDLHSLPKESFENLTSIEKLDLSKNILKTIDLNILNLKKLEVLDLSSNQISFLNETFQEQLEAVSSHNANFQLRLGGNPFLCDCTSVQFLQWLRKTNVTVDDRETFQCVNIATLLVNVDTEQLLQGCAQTILNSGHYVAIGIMATIVVVAIVGIFVIYKQRWKMAWYMYSLKRRLFKSSHKEVEMDRKYDAFVAYHIEHETNDHGVTWVVNELRDHVEGRWDKLLFIFDRNASVGGTKISQIIYGIQQSRKVLFVLTENYIKSGLWEMVLYWAVRQGLNNVIMCCLGDMNIDKFPPSLAKVAIELQERYPTHYLEFPLQSTCTGVGESTMWSNLEIALGTC